MSDHARRSVDLIRGVDSEPEETLLTTRALSYLSAGPADVVDLIGHICSLPGAPRIVAEHMAHAMFAGRPQFVRAADGRWMLAAIAPKAYPESVGRSRTAAGSNDSLHGRRLCTVKMARKILPQLSRRSLDHLARYYGIEIRNRHRAGGDALATAKCLVRMLSDLADRGCATWGELQTLLRTQPGRRKNRRPSGMPTPVTRDTTA